MGRLGRLGQASMWIGGLLTALATFSAPPALAHDDASLVGEFLERLHPFGDLRLRYENDRNRPDKDTRNRGRARFRLGASYDINDEFAATFRLRTGNSDDPNSPNVTFGSAFDSFEVSLDQLFLAYEPSWLEGVRVRGGKVPMGFATDPVFGELVWDADVNPEGGQAGYTFDVSGTELGLVAGAYVVVENDDAGDGSFFAIQGSARRQLSERVGAMLAVGWNRYANLEPGGDTKIVDDNNGNLLRDTDGDGDADRFASDFSILNPIAALTFDCGEFPITLSGEYIFNAGARHGRHDQGYAVGARLDGKFLERSFHFFYQYARIEQESVFSPFAQDDFLQATNYEGHVFGVQVGVWKQINVRLWGLFSRTLRESTGGPDDLQQRARIDINARF